MSGITSKSRKESKVEMPPQVHIPITPPPAANMRCPLELWVQTERTPLLLVPTLPPRTTSSEINVEVSSDGNGDDTRELIPQKVQSETAWSTACQVIVPFFIAGVGTVAAGLLLDTVQNWTVFQIIPEIFVLVPALLGLKGNLEMTLASRISTQANLGMIDSTREQWKLALGNLSLLQCQALVLGLVASLIASIVGWAREGELNLHNVLLLTSSSLLTASTASLLLGSLTIFVVILSRKFNINPDNVAAPISASLGDVVTLALLASFASLQFSLAAHNGYYLWVEGGVLLFLLCLVPMWALFSYRCSYTRQVLFSGWVPVISAVAISSGGGYILNFAVATYNGIAACQPVINGVGGNLVAVQACRISTYLHLQGKPGEMPRNYDGSAESVCVSPFTAWFGKSAHASTARILMLMAIPGHLIFITCIHFLKSDHSTPLTAQFLLLYLAAALLQVSILLYLAHCLVYGLWRFGFDPDDAAIPYLTATGDLLGTSLLYLAFLAMDFL